MEPTMKLRPGAVDKGRMNEQKMAALVATKLSLDDNVEDFWMSSNIEGVGAFDDLVVSIQYKDGIKNLYFVQFKHIEKETLQMKLMEADKSDFSLKKYEQGFNIIKDRIGKDKMFENVDLGHIFLILHTNAKLIGDCVKLTVTSVEGPSLTNTSTQSNIIYQIGNSGDSVLNKTFLSRFFLYSNQANAPRIDEIIKKTIYSHFRSVHNTLVFSLTHFFSIWSLGRKNKIKTLQKRNVQLELLELNFLPYIIDPSITTELDCNIVHLIRKTTMCYNVVCIAQERSLQKLFYTIKRIIEDICQVKIDISDSWNTHLTRHQLDCVFAESKDPNRVKMVATLRERSQFQPHITLKDLYLAAWQCRLVPLVIDCSLSQETVRESLKKFEKITPDLSFILLKPNFIVDCKHLSLFRTFLDIDDLELLKANLNSMAISLQGKAKYFMNDFYKNNKILSAITPDIYLSLLNQTLELGTMIELEDYYVKRHISRPKLSMKVIGDVNVISVNELISKRKTDLFIIVNPDNIFILLSKTSKHVIDLQFYFQSILNGARNNNVNILIANDQDIGKLINTAYTLKKTTAKAVHLLKFIDKHILEWIFSVGRIDTLKEYVLESESDIYDNSEDSISYCMESKLNLLISSAGMGKTMFLKSMANRYRPETWISYVNLSDHYTEIRKMQTMEQLLEYIIKFETKDNDEILRIFSETVYRDCIEKQQLVLLLDGYDEIASSEGLSFLKTVVLSDIAKIWITSRQSCKDELENELNTFSIDIASFTEDNRNFFLRNYITSKKDNFSFSEQQVEYIINSIEKCSKMSDDSYISIPLYTKMLADVYADDYDKISGRINMSLVDIYDAYIDIRLREHRSYETSSFRHTISKLALKLLYYPEQLEGIIEYQELLSDIPEFGYCYGKDAIITEVTENGHAHFGHRTYAEFLAADYISKQLNSADPVEKVKWSDLAQVLLEDELQPVKSFFDKIKKQSLKTELKEVETEIKKSVCDFIQSKSLPAEARDEIDDAVKYLKSQVQPTVKKLEKRLKKFRF